VCARSFNVCDNDADLEIVESVRSKMREVEVWKLLGKEQEAMVVCGEAREGGGVGSRVLVYCVAPSFRFLNVFDSLVSREGEVGFWMMRLAVTREAAK
jgi:hypothetical protein